MNAILREAWDRWKIIGEVIGSFQGRLILQLFYFTILAPFGLMVTLFSDPLKIKQPDAGSAWSARGPVSQALDEARRQF